MTDEDRFVVRVRPETQLALLAVLVVIAAALIYLALAAPGLTSSTARGGGPAIAIGLAVAILAIAGYVARRMLDPRRASTVIDAEGVRSGRMALRWPEIARVGYAADGRNIWIAGPGAARGILVDPGGADHGETEILAAIERFSRAAGRELDLPSPPSARASARSR